MRAHRSCVESAGNEGKAGVRLEPAMNMENLKRWNPEWKPWLGVIEKVFEELENAGWNESVPLSLAPRNDSAPLLAKAAVSPDVSIVRLFETLNCTAAHSGAPYMTSLQVPAHSAVFALQVFHGALNGDEWQLRMLANDTSADPEAFLAVAALLPIPFLHACTRRWKSQIPIGWSEGYCPICGSWPALAEICGVERNRSLRCGRCGAAWQVLCLACPYCSMADHEQLASLVAEHEGARAAIEVCKRCQGYVKVLTKLRMGAPAEVMIDDVTSVALDVAAADRGYHRPHGLGYAINVKLSGTVFEIARTP